MNRRQFTRLFAALGSLQGVQALAGKPDPGFNREPVVGDRSQESMETFALFLDGTPLRVGILVYPGMYVNDVTTLMTIFDALAGTQILFIGKSMDPVGHGENEPPALLPITPHVTFETCPAQLDVLLVPGAMPGKLAQLSDEPTLAFLRQQADQVKFLGSVGTGSLLLGAAGVLRGYKATTYWPMRELLQGTGATLVKQRVVFDRNRATAAGSTAAIDLGLRLAEKLRNPAQAQLIQLYMEYDPQPPYKSGSPERAPAKVTRFMTHMHEGLVEQGKATMREAVSKLKP